MIFSRRATAIPIAPISSDVVTRGRARQDVIAACIVVWTAAVVIAAPAALAAHGDHEYAGVSDAQARSVSDQHFGAILDDNAQLAPRLNPGERVLKYQGDATAIITGANGRSLMQSTIPLRSVDDEGHKREELYPDVVDRAEQEHGGVPSRLMKTDRPVGGKEGTPWWMFAGSPSGRTTIGSWSRWTIWRARALAG